MYDFFIAHAGSDTNRAADLHDLLKTTHSVFFDKVSLEAGDNWAKVLSEALENSKVIVVLLSKNAHQAYYLQEEIARAIQLYRSNKNWYRVVPVYLDGFPVNIVEIPYGLYQLHSLDFSIERDLESISKKLSRFLDEAPDNNSDAVKVKDDLSFKHVLHEYPEGPMVEGHLIPTIIIESFAEFVDDSLSLQVINEANAFRKAADPNEEGSILIQRIRLPNPNRNNPLEFWLAAFNQAKLHGPRMLAALLMSVPDTYFKKEVKNFKNKLLQQLKSYQ